MPILYLYLQYLKCKNLLKTLMAKSLTAKRRKTYRQTTWRRRKVRITSAKAVPQPIFARNNKPNNQLKAQGLRYEKKVLESLSASALHDSYEIYHNPWFYYNDEFFCSPDFILWPTEPEAPLIIIECKLKYTLDGTNKLQNLYIPVIRKAYNLTTDPIGIVIAKSLTPEVKKTIAKIRDAKPLENNILLWLGHTKLTT